MRNCGVEKKYTFRRAKTVPKNDTGLCYYHSPSLAIFSKVGVKMNREPIYGVRKIVIMMICRFSHGFKAADIPG